jgi:hypothetical protein
LSHVEQARCLDGRPTPKFRLGDFGIKGNCVRERLWDSLRDEGQRSPWSPLLRWRPDADSGGVKAAQWAALWIGGGGKGICSR